MKCKLIEWTHNKAREEKKRKEMEKNETLTLFIMSWNRQYLTEIQMNKTRSRTKAAGQQNCVCVHAVANEKLLHWFAIMDSF